jgi:hypothetical protein
MVPSAAVADATDAPTAPAAASTATTVVSTANRSRGIGVCMMGPSDLNAEPAQRLWRAPVYADCALIFLPTE